MKKQNNYLAQGCGTYSKLKRNYAYNVPDTIDYGRYDGIYSDHKNWFDWSCGLGSNIVGWLNNFSLNSSLAEHVARLMCKRFGFEKAKILQSGSAACDAAVRIARAYTSKHFVFWTGYHGCGNTFISCEIPGLGTTREPSTKHINEDNLIHDLKGTSKTNQIAAVVIEPVRLEYSKKRISELKEIRQLTKKLGIILIFDEIITGLRFPKGSVAKATGIYPDLLCVGKSIGNGYPISAVLGPKELMEQDYFISNTHNANEIALKESMRILVRLNDKCIEEMWERGKVFMDEANKILSRLKDKSTKLVGYPTRAEWQSSDLKTLTSIWEIMADNGHICGRALFINYNHTKEIMDKFLFDLNLSITSINKGYKPKGRLVSFSFKRN